MKKIVSYLLFLFVLVVPVTARAANVSLGISCPTSAVLSASVDCKVSVTSDVLVNGVVANYSFSGASYVSFTPLSGFTAQYTSDKGFNVGNVSGQSGTFEIGTLRVKMSGAATIGLTKIDISDTDFNSYTSADRSATISLASSNNKLASLSLSTGTLSPAFNADTLEYSATVSTDSVTINATKGDEGQTITGIGSKTLKIGSNTFDVVVKSAAGTFRTYKINIIREDNRSSNNNLKSLSVDVGTLQFNKSTTSYSIKVASDVESANISATLEDSKASFAKSYGPRKVNLKYGANAVQIKVNAENGSSKTYTININREDNRSGNANLSSLSLSVGNIAFAKEVMDYNTTVPFNVTQIEVTATAEDSKSKVEVSNAELVVGDNVIKVTVTSETGKSQVYTINVKRLDESEMPSDNNNVTSINIKGHGINFNPETKVYEISIGDEVALVIDVLLEDPKANYVIEGNDNLRDGSVIKVTSTSESGLKNEYKINITKNVKASERRKVSSELLFGIIGLVCGLGLMFVVMLIVNKKNRDKEYKKALAHREDLFKFEVPAIELAPMQPVSAPTTAPKVEVAPVAPPPVAEEVVQPVIPANQPTPVMQEADVKQPVSQEVNIIPDNKEEEK